MSNNAQQNVGSLHGSVFQKLFGTDGIRGQAGNFISPQLCLQIGYSFGISLESEGPLLIGQDSRESGSMISSALASGLNSAGREVWLLGICPTPAIPNLIKKHQAAGGLMVSASHNPPQDNGIKFFKQ